jgi:putative holliday junction resolvase
MQRILCIDYGSARLGLAISDPLHMIASPLCVLAGSKNPVKAAAVVASEINKRRLEIGLILIGMPLLLTGEEAERAKEVRLFAQALETETQIAIQFFDERLTSVQAERSMKEAQMSRKKRSVFVDTVASTILLQSYLDLQSLKEQP